jgi:hypothetical protein
MELGLLREPQASAGVELPQRRPFGPLDIGEAGGVTRSQLVPQDVQGFARGHEQVTVDALERAIDLLAPHDALDLVDGCGVAFGQRTCAGFTVETSHDVITIVECGG